MRFALTLVAAILSTHFAPHFEGTWTGRVRMDPAKYQSKSVTPQRLKMIEAAYKSLESTKATLILRQDGTFTNTVVKGPSKTVENGTWKPEPGGLILRVTKSGGQSRLFHMVAFAGETKLRRMGQMPSGMEMVFTRAH